MKELLSTIEALREELKQYGRVAGVCSTSNSIRQYRHVAELPDNVNCVNAQAGVITAAQGRSANSASATSRARRPAGDHQFHDFDPADAVRLPPAGGRAGCENNELLVRVQGARGRITYC